MRQNQVQTQIATVNAELAVKEELTDMMELNVQLQNDNQALQNQLAQIKQTLNN
jgi:regulator of replication initiation timing